GANAAQARLYFIGAGGTRGKLLAKAQRAQSSPGHASHANEEPFRPRWLCAVCAFARNLAFLPRFPRSPLDTFSTGRVHFVRVGRLPRLAGRRALLEGTPPSERVVPIPETPSGEGAHQRYS